MSKDSEQLSLKMSDSKANAQQVVCLGMTFENDKARRKYFRNELRNKLPELKEIEGFPIGEDEDIIALSDPPYYTACPNPWVNNFIEEWEKEKVKKYGREPEEEYHREPFASDVSIGKNDPIYNAHFYHTKVPYKAIMKYLLHYTDPGDIILDGFSGSGMLGVASQISRYKEDISNLKEQSENYGYRNSILLDLSPFATFISKNNNSIGDFSGSIGEIKSILHKVESKNKYLIETQHNGWPRGAEIKDRKNRNKAGGKGIINYTVWSDVFICDNCTNEIIYWDLVFNGPKKPLKQKITCSHCHAVQIKNKLRRSWTKKHYKIINESIDVAKQQPVLINYTYEGKRYEKHPDNNDLKRINEVSEKAGNIINQFNIAMIPEGFNLNQPKKSHGVLYNFQFFTELNLYLYNEILSEINSRKLKETHKNYIDFLLSASIQRTLRFNRYMPNHDRHVGPLSGTLYISQLTAEIPLISYVKDKLKDIIKCDPRINNQAKSIISTQSTTNLYNVKKNSIDYIFTDPPFGENLNYSELNYIWESFNGVVTNNNKEAIINSFQSKGLMDYQRLMEKCFGMMYSVLKPGRWITVEFSNSKNAVWNSIQEALNKAGFIVADVRVLDKKKGTTKQMSYMATAKQDLIISAYKPESADIKEIELSRNTIYSSWIFTEKHLKKLPVFVGEKGQSEIVSERTPRILYDRMVAFHVQNGLSVPISSAEFQEGVAQRFPIRDGMAFLESQVAEYDKKRILVKDFSQQSLFVSDENSAIEWIRQHLMRKPQSRQEIHPNFMKEIQHIAKHEVLPELDDLLNQNFLNYSGTGNVPDQIVSYLRRNYKNLRQLEPDNPNIIAKAMNRWYVPDPSKQADLEKLRERSLLREFEGYLSELEGSKKKLRQFRTEAVRAGFKKAYSEKDFKKIVEVGDRLPEKIIQEDDKLLMFYDNASILLDS